MIFYIRHFGLNVETLLLILSILVSKLNILFCYRSLMRVSIWMAMICFCFSNDVQSPQELNVIQSDSVIFEKVKSVTTTKSSWKLG